MRWGDFEFGPPGAKPRRVDGGGRASLVRRSGEFGAADAQPKLSTHRSGGGRSGGHRCERHGRGGERNIGGPRRRGHERARRVRPSGGERARWRVSGERSEEVRLVELGPDGEGAGRLSAERGA